MKQVHSVKSWQVSIAMLPQSGNVWVTESESTFDLYESILSEYLIGGQTRWLASDLFKGYGNISIRSSNKKVTVVLDKLLKVGPHDFCFNLQPSYLIHRNCWCKEIKKLKGS